MYPQRSVMTCGLATALEPPHFNPRTRVGCDTMTSQFCRHFVRVSIHAPAWGATRHPLGHQIAGAGFNPRTRVGCDMSRLTKISPLSMFQSTHPRGVRHQLSKRDAQLFLFQSTHPRGVRPLTGPKLCNCEYSFNPRTRVGCDCCACGGTIAPEDVSVHAPAWGATRLARIEALLEALFQSTHPRGVRRRCGTRGIRPCGVSIHAPAWGATLSSGLKTAFEARFQSTHPRGVRRISRHHRHITTIVSIHAPAWGATHAPRSTATRMGKFQSTHPRGVRLPLYARQRFFIMFQSTHPRGVRPGEFQVAHGMIRVSIHAPAWGATWARA